MRLAHSSLTVSPGAVCAGSSLGSSLLLRLLMALGFRGLRFSGFCLDFVLVEGVRVQGFRGSGKILLFGPSFPSAHVRSRNAIGSRKFRAWDSGLKGLRLRAYRG